MLIKTPVVLLIYNRPEYTQKVFSAIERVEPETLFVIADGPKDDSDLTNCERARSIVERISWECKILTNYSDHNLGLKKRISSGLEWVFSQVEEAIILEDDCVPSYSFFGFCQLLLERYRDDERVMMISGSNFLPDVKATDESYFFSRYFSIWGWATWRRAWEKYDLYMSDWTNYREKGFVKSLFRQSFAANYLDEMMENAYRGYSDTWDIQWFYTCLKNHGLNIVPSVNMVSNIGFLGVHSEEISLNQGIPVEEMDLGKMTHPDILCPNPLYDEEFLRRNFSDTGDNRLTIYKRIKLFERKIRRALKNIKSNNNPMNEIDHKEYSTIVGKDTIVPCQWDAYFLALNRYIRYGDRVLDVGFGLGYGLNISAIKAESVSGVEVDPKVLGYCQTTVVGRNPKLDSIEIYDGYNLRFSDNSFDVITCVDVIEHVEDYDRLLEEMMRVAKRGVFISTPNRRPEFTNPDGKPKNRWHLREWTRAELEIILDNHGLIEWNHLNGPYDGPFAWSDQVEANTITLSPFIRVTVDAQ